MSAIDARTLGNEIEDVIAGRRPWSLLEGNALDLLALIEDNSIHLSASSPPYYGLRCYKTTPQIWTLEPNCDHEWAEPVVRQRVGWESTPAGQKQFKSAISAAYKSHSQICTKCDGWLGHLGNENIPDCRGWAQWPEPTMCAQCYICHLRMIYAEVYRVLRPDGCCFVNLGDSYSASGKGGRHVTPTPDRSKRGPGRWGGGSSEVDNLPAKNLMGIPWRFALALQADGWILRQEIIWEKPSAMAESVKDRCTKSHEHIFLLSKSPHYFFDHIAIREPAKMTSVARMSRGVSDHHKNIDGAPGQPPHSFNQPRPNTNPKFGGDKAAGYGTRIHSGKEWNPSMAGGAIGIADRKSQDSNGEPYITANRRTVWNISNSGYRGDHFATFPVKLVEPMIAAGTSERGCCTICGRGWVRVIRKGLQAPEPGHRHPAKRLEPGQSGNMTMGFRASKLSGEEMAEWKEAHPDETVGWRPDPKCKHYDHYYRTEFTRTRNTRKFYQQFKTGSWFERARKRPGLDTWPVIPAVVLDPFLGTGTTIVTARRMGRAGIGLELSEEYARVARARIVNDAPLFNSVFDEGSTEETPLSNTIFDEGSPCQTPEQQQNRPAQSDWPEKQVSIIDMTSDAETAPADGSVAG